MKKEVYIFSAVTLISLIFHLLCVLKIFYPDSFFTLPLTAGMVFSWLFSSSVIKDKKTANENLSYRELFGKIPFILRTFTLISMGYGIINFFTHMSVREEEGWVDFDLSHEKLSGLSGFWIAFYMIGLCAAWLKNINSFNSVGTE